MHTVARTSLIGLMLGALSGCGDPEPTAPEPEKPSLHLEAAQPANGSVVPTNLRVPIRLTLRYSLGESTSGSLGVLMICTKDGRLACLEAGTLKELNTHNGVEEVVLGLGPMPAGANAQVSISLSVGSATNPVKAVAVAYSTPPQDLTKER
jgi:hypothetical protein